MSDESQKQILKATSIIGGAQFLSIVIGIVRTKAVALLLGPYGLGVVGMLQSIIDIVRNVTGFGLNYSGVKDVAEADASGNLHKLNETITVLRNLVLWTGLLGTILTIIFAKPLSIFTFGNSQYTLSVVYLSITLLLSSISGGQMALLQGKREIKLMAKATLYGAIYSTFISILVYYLFGVNGIVPVLIISSIIPLVFSWYYSRKIKFERQQIAFKASLSKGLSMARLGFFIVVTGFMASLTLYVIRVIIVDKMNIEGVGFFQASWMISTTYIGIILNAMLSDFFPRLSAINKDKQASNKLVNDQLEIALVLGTPMILFLIATAGLLVEILYSTSFLNTVSILQWQLFGAFFTLISWPLGVLFLAKNKGKFCIITDGFWSLLFLGIVFFGWEYFGFKILGIGDSIAIIFKLVLVFFLVKKIGDFKFSLKNVKTIVYYGFLTVLMMLNVLFFESYIQYLLSFGLIIIAGIKSLITLNNLYNFKDKFRFNGV
jgi:antigen flippase